MRGFGNHEAEKGSTVDEEEIDDETFRKNLSKDIVLAIDRDLNGTLNFNE